MNVGKESDPELPEVWCFSMLLRQVWTVEMVWIRTAALQDARERDSFF